MIFCDSLEEALVEVEKYCLSFPSIENCGFLGWNKKTKRYVVQPCENKSDKPDEYFLISPYDHIDFTQKNSIICVYHSHVKSSEASESDRLGCKNTCLPYLIYGVGDKSFSFIEPRILDTESCYQKGVKELKKELNS